MPAKSSLQPPLSPLQKVRQLINTLLMANVMVVTFGFLWFVIAVSGALIGSPLGYQLWIRLWLPLFQPALGILMAGALVSGVWGWWAKRLKQDG